MAVSPGSGHVGCVAPLKPPVRVFKGDRASQRFKPLPAPRRILGNYILGRHLDQIYKSQTLVLPFVDAPAPVFLFQEKVATQDLKDAPTCAVMGNNYRSIDLSLDTLQDVKGKVWLMGRVDCCGRRLQGPVMVRRECRFSKGRMQYKHRQIRQKAKGRAIVLKQNLVHK